MGKPRSKTEVRGRRVRGVRRVVLGQGACFLGRSEGDSKPAHAKTCVCGTRNFSAGLSATLYEGVGSVKRHLDCASCGTRFFFLTWKNLFLSCISTKARS